METTTKKGESTCRADFASRTKLKSAMPFNKVLTDFMTGRNNKSLKELKEMIMTTN